MPTSRKIVKKMKPTASQPVITNPDVIKEILERGTVDIIPKLELEKLLQSGRTLRVKLGIDPSGPDLHLGHAVPLRKLRQFQRAGHQAVIVIGDWTARIGDPTGKNKMRPQLTAATVKKNADQYLKQLFLILDKKNTQVVWQSAWFNKFTLQEIIDLISKFTVAQLMEREDFQKRQQAGGEIGYHEPMYALLQAYDSVVIKADIELGDPAQLFNMLRGRDLQGMCGQSPQNIITVKTLIGLDGTQKMGKSLHNYIALLASPDEMYGQIMSIPDSLIVQYFELCTDISVNDLAAIEQQLINRSLNPRDLKMRLAHTIVGLYHSDKDAAEAETKFISLFQKKELPSDVPTKKIGQPIPLLKLLINCGLVQSASDGRRVIAEGGIKIDGRVVKDPMVLVAPTTNGVLISRGKRQFCKIISA